MLKRQNEKETQDLMCARDEGGGMWDVGCGMWDVGCGMWNVGCGMRNAR